MDIPKETRLDSYEQTIPIAEIRKKMILDLLHNHNGLTAQEIAVVLHSRGHIPSDERNYTAPRLTELREAGKVMPTGKRQCAKTGRKVTVWAAVKESDTETASIKEKLQYNLDPALIKFYKEGIKTGRINDIDFQKGGFLLE